MFYQKKIIPVIILSLLLIVAFPVIAYASGKTVGPHVTTSMGELIVNKGNSEIIHIYSSDIDYLATETQEMIEKKQELKSQIDALLTEYESIKQRDGISSP